MSKYLIIVSNFKTKLILIQVCYKIFLKNLLIKMSKYLITVSNL